MTNPASVGSVGDREIEKFPHFSPAAPLFFNLSLKICEMMLKAPLE